MLARCAGSAALSLATALGIACAAPGQAYAQASVKPEAAAPTAEPVRQLPPIRIRLIIARASEVEGPIDPGARDIYEHLPAKYHSITLIEDRTLSVNLGDQAHVYLPTGSEVRLLPVALHGGQLPHGQQPRLLRRRREARRRHDGVQAGAGVQRVRASRGRERRGHSRSERKDDRRTQVSRGPA